MKTAYLGKIQLTDVDLSHLNQAQQQSDITYIIEICPRFLSGPAFNIKKTYPRSGLFKAIDIYPEFKKLEGFVDLEKVYVLNTCGRLWIIKSFFTNLLILRFLIKNKFTAIHLAWPPNIYEFILYVLKRKMLLTVHDPFPHTGNDSWIVRLRRKMAFSLIPRLIILNKTQRQEFLNIYDLPPYRVIDSQLSTYTYLNTVIPDTANIPPNGSFILFAGKISLYKGLDYLLPAMEQVHRQCPDCHLVVAGSGKFHFDISQYLQSEFIDIRNRFIPDSELVALINNSAFMVCPYTDATQSGVIMSAFAFAKPVIATNVGGLPEMVTDGKHGLIVKEKDTEALAQAIISLWKSPTLNHTFAQNITDDYINGERSWKNTARQLHGEYQRA